MNKILKVINSIKNRLPLYYDNIIERNKPTNKPRIMRTDNFPYYGGGYSECTDSFKPISKLDLVPNEE